MRLSLIVGLGWTAVTAGTAMAQSLPPVVIVTTGGTIASRPGAETLEGTTLVEAVPELATVADVSVDEFSRIGSSQMTPAHWLALARHLTELFASQPELVGIVVTHGTDTMEETAFFLQLTVRDPRPVVLVGSMRPATAISADGPANLLNAVRVATAPHSRGKGVLIVLNDEINGARAARKTDNLRVQTFRSPELGLLGYADPDTIIYYRTPLHPHTAASEFDVSGMTTLPDVPIVADYAGASGAMIRWIHATGAPGIVVTTFAGGRMSAGTRAAVAEVAADGIPVVIVSRVPGGRIAAPPLVEGTVVSHDLPAHKARVLLMLGLANGADLDRLRRIFATY